MFKFENLSSFVSTKVFGSGEIIRAKSGKFKHWGLTAVSAVTLTMALGPALAFQVAETSFETFDDDDSVISFESSFCEVEFDVPMRVSLNTVSGDPSSLAGMALISAVVFKNADKTGVKEKKNAVTPNGKAPGKVATFDATYTVSPPTRTVDITLTFATPGWHTVHLRLPLEDGAGNHIGRLGVNLHSTPCDDAAT